MKNQQIRVKRLFTSLGFISLIFVSNNGELSARYALASNNDREENSLIINNPQLEDLIDIEESSFKTTNSNSFQQLNLAQNDGDEENPSVLISEIVIEGWQEHPEGRKLELAAYDPEIILQTGNLYSIVASKKLLLTARSHELQPLTEDDPPIQNAS